MRLSKRMIPVTDVTPLSFARVPNIESCVLGEGNSPKGSFFSAPPATEPSSRTEIVVVGAILALTEALFYKV
jgi:hypothetical protein